MERSAVSGLWAFRKLIIVVLTPFLLLPLPLLVDGQVRGDLVHVPL